MISENWPQVRGRGVSRVVITRYRSINRVDVHIYLFIRARLGLVIGEPNFIWHGILCNLWTKRNFHLRERVEHAPRDASFLRRPTHRDMYIYIYTRTRGGEDSRSAEGRRGEGRKAVTSNYTDRFIIYRRQFLLPRGESHLSGQRSNESMIRASRIRRSIDPRIDHLSSTSSSSCAGEEKLKKLTREDISFSLFLLTRTSRRDILQSRKKERESGVNFSQASSVFNSCHCFEAGVVVSRNFSISIPPLERHQPSFPTILYAS